MNKMGEKVIQLCIGNKRILNGRKTGDVTGKYTSYQKTGVSVIDYGIVSEPLWKDIISFQVHPISIYSDHCHISFKLSELR